MSESSAFSGLEVYLLYIVRVYGCQNEGVFIKATKSLKKAVLNQKLHKTPKN